MALKEKSRERNTEMIPAETLRPLISYTLGKISSEEREMLMIGKPELMTRNLLAMLMAEILCFCIRNSLSYTEALGRQITEEEVSDAIASALPQSFKETLDLQDGVSSKSAEKLNKMMAEEVIEGIKFLSSCDDFLTAMPRLPSPTLLDAMADAAVEMISSTKSPSSRSSSALMDSEALQCLEGTDVEDPLSPETVEDTPPIPKKAYVDMMVYRSVARLFNNAELHYSFDVLQKDFKWLVDDVWWHLQDEDIDVRSDRFQELHKSIFKDLLKRCGNLSQILVLLDQKVPQMSSCIASAIRYQMKKK